jgi:hypothetical protein
MMISRGPCRCLAQWGLSQQPPPTANSILVVETADSFLVRLTLGGLPSLFLAVVKRSECLPVAVGEVEDKRWRWCLSKDGDLKKSEKRNPPSFHMPYPHVITWVTQWLTIPERRRPASQTPHLHAKDDRSGGKGRGVVSVVMSGVWRVTRRRFSTEGNFAFCCNE